MHLHRTDEAADLEVREAVVEKNVPAAEEELLLTDTQQAGHQRIQGLVQRGKTDGRKLNEAHDKFGRDEPTYQPNIDVDKQHFSDLLQFYSG